MYASTLLFDTKPFSSSRSFSDLDRSTIVANVVRRNGVNSSASDALLSTLILPRRDDDFRSLRGATLKAQIPALNSPFKRHLFAVK